MNCIAVNIPAASLTTPVVIDLKKGQSITGGFSMSGQSDNHIWSKDNFTAFIRARFPQSPEYHLASITGIPASTCRKHFTGETKPGADHVLAYLGVFGPAFLQAVMGKSAPGWVERGKRYETRHQLQLQKNQIEQRLAEFG